MERSFLPYIAPDIPLNSLCSDTQYFTHMGDDGVKVAYFKAYIRHMRRAHRGFGNACYLDSTPLPNDSRDNPFCKLCSHGLKGTDVQMRLALFLDQDTGKPVWFDVIPGNMIDIRSLVLDAGYVSGELVSQFNCDNGGPGDDGRRMIARMPKRNGYTFEELYESSRRMFSNAKYTFVRNGNRYFGRRKEVAVFGQREYAYVYVDFDNALCRFEKYVRDKPEEYASLTDGEKTRKMYEFGYFVLISNVKMDPLRQDGYRGLLQDLEWVSQPPSDIQMDRFDCPREDTLGHRQHTHLHRYGGLLPVGGVPHDQCVRSDTIPHVLQDGGLGVRRVPEQGYESALRGYGNRGAFAHIPRRVQGEQPRHSPMQCYFYSILGIIPPTYPNGK